MSDKQCLWDWRKYFSESNLELGRRDATSGKVLNFECDPAGAWARCKTPNGFSVHVNKAPTRYSELLHYPNWSDLTGSVNLSHKLYFKNYYNCSCSMGSLGQRCRHLASLMFRWEQAHGPFALAETDEEREQRLRQEAETRRKEQLERQKKAMLADIFPATDFLLQGLKPSPAGLFYRPDTALRSAELLTNRYEAELYRQLMNDPDAAKLEVSTRFYPGQPQQLHASARFGNILSTIVLDRDSIRELECQCGQSRLRAYWYANNRQGRLCCHAMALWTMLRDWIIRDNPGDETDYMGMRLLSLMTGGAESARTAAEPAQAKRPCVVLSPRIVRDKSYGDLRLGFDIGRASERLYAVKSLEKLVNAAEADQAYPISKAVTLDFAQEDFIDASKPWLRLVQSRVRTVHGVNDRLNRSYYYTPTLSAGAGIPLEESDLDVVYDLAEGGSIQYQYGSRAEVCSVRVSEATPRARLVLKPITSNGKLAGISVQGSTPRLLRGSRHRYILDRTCFGRVQEGEASLLGLLQGLSEGEEEFTCAIGRKKLPEFCYRVLPALENSPQISVVDEVGDLVNVLLPPEPRFTFQLDLSDSSITCDPAVRYGDEASRSLLTGGDAPVQRDADQENRVLRVLKQFFPQRRKGLLCCPLDDDSLVYILTDGVATLSGYGEVLGSDAFNRVHVRPTPQPRFSVRVEGGLLDLSVMTRDMTGDELLALLASYRMKKRWHRLKSGDFVDLADPAALDALEETARAMDLSVEALVKDGAHLPGYRALYVEKLLEAHEQLAASRDRGFKALIRSFQTIKDSDFEASEALMDVLRPYQLYGFRWLSTLAQAGFGGILADEMGLGKTVQALAFLQVQKARGESRPALVVCPASLVYNWTDECRRFTPELSVEALAGGLKQRKEQLRRMSADLYITSYDLLKRDIALYDGLVFSTVILDEAQFVKNPKAAVSKAVRVLNAEHRFALTGTPIENRLSELWSLFDFLMPGFLYTASEFGARFEGPITRQKDAEAAEKLARMTSPFILRRRKTDVLRDLPEKLEENRSFEMEPDQRRLYDAQLVRMRALLDSSGDSGEDKMRILAEITRLRQLCCDPSLLFDDYHGSSAKRAACLDLIQSAMDAGHRMLVFSQFTSMLALLEADLKAAGIPFYKLTGSTDKQERLRMVNAFNKDSTPVFLISLKAGGTGLNLTGADVVIHYDPWWNLAAQNQATDRAHRIGQTRQVTVVKLIAADTIEERILRLQQTKRELAEAILTGEHTSLMSLSREELLALLG